VKSLLLLAVIAQYQMPPSPPAPPSGGPALESELSRMAERYRTRCYSEKAIKIMVDSIRQARTADRSPELEAIRATNKELADAAFAEPFQLDRMITAIRARAKAQADSQAQYPEREIAVLQKLPKADQVLYAQQNSLATSVFPQKTCLQSQPRQP